MTASLKPQRPDIDASPFDWSRYDRATETYEIHRRGLRYAAEPFANDIANLEYALDPAVAVSAAVLVAAAAFQIALDEALAAYDLATVSDLRSDAADAFDDAKYAERRGTR